MKFGVLIISPLTIAGSRSGHSSSAVGCALNSLARRVLDVGHHRQGFDLAGYDKFRCDSPHSSEHG